MKRRLNITVCVTGRNWNAQLRSYRCGNVIRRTCHQENSAQSPHTAHKLPYIALNPPPYSTQAPIYSTQSPAYNAQSSHVAHKPRSVALMPPCVSRLYRLFRLKIIAPAETDGRYKILESESVYSWDCSRFLDFIVTQERTKCNLLFGERALSLEIRRVEFEKSTDRKSVV